MHWNWGQALRTIGYNFRGWRLLSPSRMQHVAKSNSKKKKSTNISWRHKQTTDENKIMGLFLVRGCMWPWGVWEASKLKHRMIWTWFKDTSTEKCRRHDKLFYTRMPSKGLRTLSFVNVRKQGYELHSGCECVSVSWRYSAGCVTAPDLAAWERNVSVNGRYVDIEVNKSPYMFKAFAMNSKPKLTFVDILRIFDSHVCLWIWKHLFASVKVLLIK